MTGLIIKKKRLLTLFIVVMAVMGAMAGGCATVKIKDPSGFELETTTFGKDIQVDPNGVMSTVSPKNQGIIEALAGFAAGAAAVGL